MDGSGWAWFQLTDLVDTLGDPFARNPSSCENQDYLAPRWCDVCSVFHLGCLGVLRSLDHHFLKSCILQNKVKIAATPTPQEVV